MGKEESSGEESADSRIVAVKRKWESSTSDEEEIIEIPENTEILSQGNENGKRPENVAGWIKKYFGVFRFATNSEISLMGFAAMLSILQGIGTQILGIVFGRITNVMFKATIFGLQLNNGSVTVGTHYQGIGLLNKTNFTTSDMPSHYKLGTKLGFDDESVYQFGYVTIQEFNRETKICTVSFLGIGVLAFLVTFVQNYIWELVGERIILRLRHFHFREILRQDMSWYDAYMKEGLSSKLPDYMGKVRDSLGYKYGLILQFISSFFGGIIVGIWIDTPVAITLLFMSPLLILITALFTLNVANVAAREQEKCQEANEIAEEVLTSLRTVLAFGAENKAVDSYRKALQNVKKKTLTKYIPTVCSLLFIYLATFGGYIVFIYFGSRHTMNESLLLGDLFVIVFSVMVVYLSASNIMPSLDSLSHSAEATYKLMEIFDRDPSIGSSSKNGLKPKKLEQTIEFKNVYFQYPTRSNAPVLKGLNFKVNSGDTVVIVGASGAGKSTIIDLILRLYDVNDGEVIIEGMNVKHLDLKWLRKYIAVVSQESIMIGVSILENIRSGIDIPDHLILRAANMADLHTFVSSLSQGYNTCVGERGVILSHAQKQRIAIARAIARGAKIIILDEALFPLDSKKEALVEAALGQAKVRATTIITGHRLTTLENANKILLLKDGFICESGTHYELIEKRGNYFAQLISQTNIIPRQFDRLLPGDKFIEHQEPFTFPDVQHEPNIDEKFLKEIKNSSVVFPVACLIRFNRNELLCIALGAVSCFFQGMVPVAVAFAIVEEFHVFTKHDTHVIDIAQVLWLIFGLIGIISAVIMVTQIYFFATANESILASLRLYYFQNVLRQEQSWFDNEKYSIRRIITHLTKDAHLIKSAVGMKAGQVLMSIVTVFLILTVALFWEIKLCIVMSFVIIILITIGNWKAKCIKQNLIAHNELMENALKISSEAIQNLHTIQTLTLEQIYEDNYKKSLDESFKKHKKQALRFALSIGLAHACSFGVFALMFDFGNHYIKEGEMTPSKVYKICFTLSVCMTGIGASLNYLPEILKADKARKTIFGSIDKQFDESMSKHEGNLMMPEGRITFKNVHFSYPGTQTPVLQDISFTAVEGETVALVGGSGCGKSTIMYLLQKFYTVNCGQLLIDDMDINTIDVTYLRSNIGVVSQQPELFNYTIKENIAFGAYREVTDQDIIEAAKLANIHEFIANLPQGYETMCGKKGCFLSEGQRQQIAIARALIRKPKILLLDEPTSALDFECQERIQDALDRARYGRTTIIIAHRLTTLLRANRIIVMSNGKIVEQGTHRDLISMCGVYYNLMFNYLIL